MNLENLKEILSEIEVDIKSINEDLNTVNLKSVLSSLDFIKVIMRIEEINHLEFNENQLKDEITRISNTTEFNGQQLFDGSCGSYKTSIVFPTPPKEVNISSLPVYLTPFIKYS